MRRYVFNTFQGLRAHRLYEEVIVQDGAEGVHRNTMVAYFKAYCSWLTGLSMCDLIDECPALLPEGGILYRGTVVREGYVVAFSGAPEDDDVTLCRRVADAIDGALASAMDVLRSERRVFAVDV